MVFTAGVIHLFDDGRLKRASVIKCSETRLRTYCRGAKMLTK